MISGLFLSCFCWYMVVVVIVCEGGEGGEGGLCRVLVGEAKSTTFFIFMQWWYPANLI